VEFNKIRLEPVSAVISDWIAGPFFSVLIAGLAILLVCYFLGWMSRPEKQVRLCKFGITAELNAIQSLDSHQRFLQF
jgi:hypothetical protein